MDLGPWIYNPLEQFANKGEMIESFVGQELLGYSPYWKQNNLYYWHRQARASQAEVDYIIQQKEIRIKNFEVKINLEMIFNPLNFYFALKRSLNAYSGRAG